MKQTLIILFLSLLAITVNSQSVLNKIKQKAEQAAERAVEKKLTPNQSNPPAGSGAPSTETGGNTSGNSGNSASNKGGGGLISTPPDVKQNLLDAETSYKSKNYSESRYAVQQAMLGVEMEIGNNILAKLPEAVLGLPKEAEADQVTSSGWGWVGLTIHREYFKDDKELKITIANNSAWMSAFNMYISNSGYSQSTGGQQNWKQIKVKGYKGVIEYNESSGYKITVGLGQSSLIVWEGINFSTEPEMIKAAEAFDIEGIKKQLGEN